MHGSLEKILSLAVLAGEIMLKNGGETRRVEETMEHIARAGGAAQVQSFVIPTGVFLSVFDEKGEARTAIRRIHERTINLDRIAKVNELSRRLVDGRAEFSSAEALLKRIAREKTGFSLLPSMVASGLVAATTTIVMDATIPEDLAAFLAAFAVRYVAHVVSRRHGVQFIFEFLGGITVAAVGVLLQVIFPQMGRDMVIIGGVMPLVPGVAITNAIRDLIGGDLLSSVSRVMETACSAAAVTMGVLIVLAISGIFL